MRCSYQTHALPDTIIYTAIKLTYYCILRLYSLQIVCELTESICIRSDYAHVLIVLLQLVRYNKVNVLQITTIVFTAFTLTNYRLRSVDAHVWVVIQKE